MTWITQPQFNRPTGLAIYHRPAASHAAMQTEGGSAPEGIDSTPLVFLHGVGLRAHSWQNLCQALPPEREIYAIDMAGHGQSAPLETETPQLGDYSNPIADWLKSIGRPVHLIGHSMGASIALDIAIHYPARLKSVTALNAIYQRSAKAAQAVQARALALNVLSQSDLNTDTTLARWFGTAPSGDQLQAAKECKAWLHGTPIAQYRKAYTVFAHYDGPSQDSLRQIPVPALFATGALEPNSTPAMSETLASLTPMGQARILPNAAHMMPMTHAKDLADILTAFLKD